MKAYLDVQAEAAPSWPAGAAQDYPGISVVHPEPRHDPGSPQTPQGGHHSLGTQTEGTTILATDWHQKYKDEQDDKLVAVYAHAN